MKRRRFAACELTGFSLDRFHGSPSPISISVALARAGVDRTHVGSHPLGCLRGEKRGTAFVPSIGGSPPIGVLPETTRRHLAVARGRTTRITDPVRGRNHLVCAPAETGDRKARGDRTPVARERGDLSTHHGAYVRFPRHPRSAGAQALQLGELRGRARNSRTSPKYGFIRGDTSR